MKRKSPPRNEERPVALHYGYVVLALIVCAFFSSLGLTRFGHTTILHAMQEGLQLSNTQVGELQTLNLIGYLLRVSLPACSPHASSRESSCRCRCASSVLP